MRVNLLVVVVALCVGLLSGALLHPAVVSSAQAAATMPADWQGIGTPRYQMYFGRFGQAETYLVDTKTGITWQLRYNREDPTELFWSALQNPTLGLMLKK
jgi:hypothetical protein